LRREAVSGFPPFLCKQVDKVHMRALSAIVPVLLIFVIGCGSEEDGLTCTPPPQITSLPPAQATAGQSYVYEVDAHYLCGMWNICNNIVGLQLPAGAIIDDYYDTIYWTPGQDHANKDIPFAIATRNDDCGDRATQSWTVHVSP
jgi:hypothetical protein